MSKTQIAFAGAIVLLSVLMGGLFFLVKRHASVVTLSSSYVLPYDYESVKRVLIQTDSAKEILAYHQGKVVESSVDQITLSAEKLLSKDWEIDAKGVYLVSRDDPDAGPMLLRFQQVSHVGKVATDSETKLMEPVGPIKMIKTTVRFSAEGNQTRVDSTVHLHYERLVTKRLVSYMDGKVNASAETSLAKNREAIENLVSKYRGKLIFRFEPKK